MPAVNHKKVRQLIAEKSRTITDRQFFSSRTFAGYLEDTASAQTRRYGANRKVKVRTVWEPRNGELACTNNSIIWINAGHKIITAKKTREERYELIVGLFSHELGHILYTDFLSASIYEQYFRSGRWYPELPPMKTSGERTNESDIRLYCKDDEKKTAMFVEFAFNLCNILEDGYVESKILNRYPGVLGSNLTVMREAQYESIGTLTQLIEQEDSGERHIWLTLEELFLSYAKFGELKYGEEPLTDKRVQTVFSLLPELDSAVTNPSAKERWNTVNVIIIRCWEYVKDFIEMCLKKSDDETAAGGVLTADEILSKILSAVKGASAKGSGVEAPIDESAAGPTSAPGKSKRQITAKLADSVKSSAAEKAEKEDESESVDNSENISADGDSGADEDETEKSEESEENENGFPADMTADETSLTQDVSSQESERIPLEQTDSVYNTDGGKTETDGEYHESGYQNSAADIERVLESMAERAVHTQLEKERSAELNELAQNISYGDIHKGVNKKIHRIAEVSDEMKERYNDIAAPLLYISKQLQRSVKQHLNDKRSGGKQTNLIMGRKLDVHALCRNDGRAFCKNMLPNSIPTIAFGLLLDESGSMGGNDRATYARAAAIILYDFCKSLEIPITVYGHSASGYAVDLYSYAEFDAIDRNDCCRLMDISARSSNRDGAALRYVAEQLSKRREDIKILALVSDGQPADIGYSGTAAEEDLRGVKQEYVRKGVLFIAAAIGSDKENIERIYGDSYMDITDLSKMPVTLTNIIKRHIRV